MMGSLFNDCDQCWFDHVAKEVSELAGTDARIYQFDEPESSIDPLWQEETTTVYKLGADGKVGIDCVVFFKSPARSSTQGEEGFNLNMTSTLQIAKAHMRELGIRRMRPGDIVFVWGRYWDVIESSSTDGQISDSGETSMYEFDVTRRTKGVPESIWRPGEDQ